MTHINTNDFNLKFTMSHSTSEITFLDVSIQKQINGRLCSEFYCKPTASNSLLHASSYHPKPLMASIPYSQYLRARRNCSNDIRFQKEADVLRTRLLKRGCSKSSLKKANQKTIKLSRRELLSIPKKLVNDDTTRVITTYSTQHKQIKRILNKY